MSIEVATYIADLQPVNPPSTDPRSQGDDHIRLIKQVLQTTFPSATHPFYRSTAATKTANYTILSTEAEVTFFCSTGLGAVTFTLPGLAAADAGWRCAFIKTSSDVNPMLITPASGSINSGGIAGLARARRCIPGARIVAIWDGANWFCTRAVALPVGSCIEFHGSALPAGYEWPNGQTLNPVSNYPEYSSVMGTVVTLDKRGRIGLPLDNLGGSAAGRIGAVMGGTSLGNTGGSETVSLVATQIPLINVAGAFSGSISGSTSGVLTGSTGATTGGGGFACIGTVSSGAASVSGSCSGSINVNSTNTAAGSNGAAHSNLQPCIMVSQVLVVE